MAEIVRDRWNGYTYLFGEGERCVVSFDVTACDLAAQVPSQLRRVIGFSPEGHVRRDGMPSPEAFARFKAIEDALLAQLRARKVSAWLVGRQVYRGFRELLFQVDDVDAFAKAYAAVEAEFGGMKLVEHPDWQFFNDKIAPGVRGYNHIGNRQVIQGLKEAGSDLAVEHALEHTFLGDAAALDGVQAALAEKGVTGTRLDDSLMVTIESPLDDQDEIDAMTMWLRHVADMHGADYDGWGAMVQRPA
jgi:regulator of RNase E activity RraB